MDRRPLLSFVLLIVAGSLCLVTGFQLLDVSNKESTLERSLGIWIPIALMASGIVMAFAAWRLLRFAALGTLMIVGGMSFMWAAPSLRPLAGQIIGGAILAIWSLWSDEPSHVTFSNYARDVFANLDLFPKDQFLQDLGFILGGLALTAIGAFFVIQRGKEKRTSQTPIKIEFEEDDKLGKRRVVVTIPLEVLPKKMIERILRKLGL